MVMVVYAGRLSTTRAPLTLVLLSSHLLSAAVHHIKCRPPASKFAPRSRDRRSGYYSTTVLLLSAADEARAKPDQTRASAAIANWEEDERERNEAKAKNRFVGKAAASHVYSPYHKVLYFIVPSIAIIAGLASAPLRSFISDGTVVTRSALF
ncbi:hypothetical protein BKA65DRAFT_479767 [Rhexocercosporidium sp. MPI-PUGE-AT-0058]|nr:hypothetical protein BKA65DRAFT_479767 [Rhexocercosporidium sp. MPI-PUGE-AT-0058]